ncbi:nuclear transport factor 2 family protein [soil metagenome]
MGDNGDIIRGIYEAFGRGDVPAVLGTLDDQCNWQEADSFAWAEGNPYIGPNAVLEGIFQRIGAELDNFAATPACFIDGGEAVAVEGRYTGTVKAIGKPVDAQFVHVWRLEGGKVVRFQQYTDTKQWSEAFSS